MQYVVRHGTHFFVFTYMCVDLTLLPGMYLYIYVFFFLHSYFFYTRYAKSYQILQITRLKQMSIQNDYDTVAKMYTNYGNPSVPGNVQGSTLCVVSQCAVRMFSMHSRCAEKRKI
jgi:hypothetical protein